MPLATIHLVSLKQSTRISKFIQTLRTTSYKPIVISKVVRWIITPENIDVNPLLHPRKPWDLLLINIGKEPLPSQLTGFLECSWTTTAGIPSRLTNTFAKTNDSLLHPDPKSIPSLTGALDNPRLGSSSQTLELSEDLSSWVISFAKTHAGKNAVSMLNLLAFKPDMHDSYLVYGKAFAESIGKHRGGSAKLVGNLVHEEIAKDGKSEKEKGRTDATGQEKDLSSWTDNVKPSVSTTTSSSALQGDPEWDEFALAHYPSILHFADMLASEDYQSVNLKYRVPALKDTCILCTSEIEIEEIEKGNSDLGIGQRAGSKSEDMKKGEGSQGFGRRAMKL